MRVVFKIIRSLFIISIFGTAGFFAGVQIADWAQNRANSARFTEWETLGKPPSDAVAVHIGEHGGYLIEGKDGAFYYCQGLQTNGPCIWHTVETNDAVLGVNYSDPAVWPEVPHPPGDVISEAFYAFSGGEMFMQTNYAVLDDGSVWIWEHGVNGMYQIGTSLSLIALGVIAGLIIGFTVSIIWWGQK